MNRGALDGSTDDHDDSANKDTHATSIAITDQADKGTCDNATERENS